MTLYQLAGAYVVALAIEGLAIEAECSDAQLDACGDDIRIARDRMLKKALAIIRAETIPYWAHNYDIDIDDKTIGLFREAVERSGDAREQAIEWAFRIAVEMGKREEFNRGIHDPMVAIIDRILRKHEGHIIRRKHEGRASEL